MLGPRDTAEMTPPPFEDGPGPAVAYAAVGSAVTTAMDTATDTAAIHLKVRIPRWSGLRQWLTLFPEHWRTLSNWYFTLMRAGDGRISQGGAGRDAAAAAPPGGAYARRARADLSRAGGQDRVVTGDHRRVLHGQGAAADRPPRCAGPAAGCDARRAGCARDRPRPPGRPAA